MRLLFSIGARHLLMLLSLCALALFLWSAPALAHKVNIFAWIEGQRICTESYFSDGRSVVQGQVEVFDGQGRSIATGQTDSAGRCSFALPPVEEVVVVLDAGMGHKASYEMAFKQGLAPEEGSHIGTGKMPTTTASRETTSESTQLQLLLGRLLDEKLAPVSRRLARLEENRISVSDVLGGIGYIVGLAGIILWVSERRKNSPR